MVKTAVSKSAAVAPEESKKAATSPIKKDKKPVDKTGDHPLPKRAGSAWLYFNTSFSKKFVEDGGVRTEAFRAASEKWKVMSEEEKQPFN